MYLWGGSSLWRYTTTLHPTQTANFSASNCQATTVTWSINTFSAVSLQCMRQRSRDTQRANAVPPRSHQTPPRTEPVHLESPSYTPQLPFTRIEESDGSCFVLGSYQKRSGVLVEALKRRIDRVSRSAPSFLVFEGNSWRVLEAT